MAIDFFDFQFIMNADGTLKEAKHNDTILDPAIGQSLFLIKEKYFKKVKQHKFDKKRIETHNAEKQKMIESWKVQKEHYQGHIRFLEKALGEKNRLLKAIGMIAYNVNSLEQKEKTV